MSRSGGWWAAISNVAATEPASSSWRFGACTRTLAQVAEHIHVAGGHQHRALAHSCGHIPIPGVSRSLHSLQGAVRHGCARASVRELKPSAETIGLDGVAEVRGTGVRYWPRTQADGGPDADAGGPDAAAPPIPQPSTGTATRAELDVSCAPNSAPFLLPVGRVRIW